MRVKLRRADQLFSQYIRRRAKWRCEACDKQFQENDQYLQASHFWGRRHESVRFDPQNVAAHCFSCHRKFTEDPESHRAWKLKQLGLLDYKLLMIRANEVKKKDDKMTILAIRELLKTLDKS